MEVAECRLSAARRADGVTAEPASWLVPPPYARSLFERGARTIVVENVSRARVAELTLRLRELVDEATPLPAEFVLPW